MGFEMAKKKTDKRAIDDKSAANKPVRAELVEVQVERAQGPSTGSGRTVKSTPCKPSKSKKPRTPAKPKKPRRPRQDGWTPAARKVFLATLRKTNCVRDACRVSDMSSTSAYRLRDRDADFDERWKEAKAHARKGLVAVAHEHAVVGKETVIYRGGVEVERRITPSDSILALLIKQGNLTEQDADKLITWDEWQNGTRFDEQGNKVDEREEAEAVRASLDAKLGAMHERLLARRAQEEERLRAREQRVEDRLRAAEALEGKLARGESSRTRLSDEQRR